MLFNELRKHGKLAARRHPMYEKNRFGRYFMYAMSLFWAGYLVFFGISFANIFADAAPNMEPYHLLNSGLVFVLALDFLIRFPFQSTPTQEMKPYLLLPVKRNRILDFLLLRSGLSRFNLLWLCMFVPFAILTVARFYGITGIITYSIGIWLLMVFNNYWYLLCRTLINERIWWVFLPVAVYTGLALSIFLFKESAVGDFFRDLGEGYIEGKPLAFAGTLVAIGVMWLVNRKVIAGLAYSELNKVEDTKVKHVSEYKFLERYGEVGEYLRLELKMLFRNKSCKMSLRTIALLISMFSAILSFSEVYDGIFMKSFIAIYSFIAFGTVILTRLMSYEGNYLDGLMSRKESIYNLLRAKYYFYSIALVIPFLLMTPAIVMKKLSLLNAFSFAFFTTGLVYFMLFQLAVYNTKTAPLNEGITGRQSTGTGFQNLISFASFGLPLSLYFGLRALWGEVAAEWILLLTGVAFTLASPLWLRNIYTRFMKRRYANMEGFRDTRQ